ncbi:MAG TPA: ATP-binding protein [Steroidobacteraceae bacterium]|nr:ATP-binding protein [Steroidobacteraceae bacterium]
MNDTSICALSPAQLLEIEALRDQRDLYHALLLSEPTLLAAGLTYALATVEQLRSLLRATTRDSAAFRGKIERLLGELDGLAQALLPLHLPTVSSRLESAQRALHEIELRSEITGNDLLPAMVVLGDLCSHITIAADCASVHVPLIESGAAAAGELETSQRRAQPKLAVALQQLADKLASEQSKHLTLVTLGLEDIPEQWVSALFDMLGQLVRNAIEHGIETPERRAELSKPEQGTVVVEFIDHGADGFELNVQDDGGGLDAARIAAIAVKKGLLSADAAQDIDPPKLASLIFQPGVSTARDGARRGHGMQIVRDHVARLEGRIRAATKNAHYTRFRIHLPPLPAEAAQSDTHA